MSHRRWWLAGAALLLLVLVASTFASSSPDGLETVAADLGFASSATEAPFGLLSDYAVSGIEGASSTAVAGIVGVLVVLAVMWLIGRGVTRRRSSDTRDT